MKGLRENTVKLVSEEEMREAETNEKKFAAEWTKRRRGCWDALSMIAEGMEKSSKEAFVT